MASCYINNLYLKKNHVVQWMSWQNSSEGTAGVMVRWEMAVTKKKNQKKNQTNRWFLLLLQDVQVMTWWLCFGFTVLPSFSSGHSHNVDGKSIGRSPSLSATTAHAWVGVGMVKWLPLLQSSSINSVFFLFCSKCSFFPSFYSEDCLPCQHEQINTWQNVYGFTSLDKNR